MSVDPNDECKRRVRAAWVAVWEFEVTIQFRVSSRDLDYLAVQYQLFLFDGREPRAWSEYYLVYGLLL